MQLYTCNSCPVPGTDISCSLIAVGRQFQFPIDYLVNKHFELTSTPRQLNPYARDLAICPEAFREVAELLLKEQHSWHHDHINFQRPESHVYHPCDIVFARRAVKSNARRRQVVKLMFSHKGSGQSIQKTQESHDKCIKSSNHSMALLMNSSTVSQRQRYKACL